MFSHLVCCLFFLLHAPGLEELITLKWPYYQIQSTDLMKSLSNYFDIFHRTSTNNPKIYMKPQKTQNYQNNPEEQKPRRCHNSPRLQTILQSYGNQDSVVLVPKQTDRPMEQNRELRNKPRHLWPINLWQRRQEHKMGKTQVFSASIAGKTGQLHANQWN